MHNIYFHLYADDIQLYVPLKPGSSDVSHILSCLTDIKWLSNNFHQLNESKTEVIVFSPSSSSSCIPDSLPSSHGIQKEAHNLGVIFDSELSFDSQVTKVVQSCFGQLRQLTRIFSFLSSTDLEKLVYAFIPSRLDYCNALYSRISKGNISGLQFIQNAAARLLTGTKRSDHISPILAALDWLPVSFRIFFKILLLVFKDLNSQAPACIGDLLLLYEPEHCLRFAGTALLMVPRSRLITKGDRAFAVHAPQLWNSLPSDLRQASPVASFNSLLKTHFCLLAFS